MIKANASAEREGIATDLLPDLTPLLDVLFMLIIFLVLTSNSLTKAFDIAVPEDSEGVAHDVNDQHTLSITIFSDAGKWAINDQEFNNKDDFKQAFIEEHEKQPDANVIVYGQKSAPIDKLMAVLTFLRTKNIENADIVME